MNDLRESETHEKQTKNEGALRYDYLKLRWDLVPFDMLEKVVEVFTYGAEKYHDENWRAGMSWKRMYASMFRHLTKSIRGEDLDPDSQCFHLAQVAWGCLCLLWYQHNNIGTDDRVIDISSKEFTFYGDKEDIDKQKDFYWKTVKYWADKKKKEQKLELDKATKEINSGKYFKKRVPLENEKYKHFKGAIYTIVYVSFDTEIDDRVLVTYIDEKGKYWTRSLNMFNEYVNDPKDETRRVRRFKKIE